MVASCERIRCFMVVRIWSKQVPGWSNASPKSTNFTALEPDDGFLETLRTDCAIRFPVFACEDFSRQPMRISAEGPRVAENNPRSGPRDAPDFDQRRP